MEEFALDSFKPLDCDFDEVIVSMQNMESNRESKLSLSKVTSFLRQEDRTTDLVAS